MIDYDTLSQFVRGDLLENYTKEQIEQMSVGEALDAWLEFNGIINYGLTIRQVLFDIATSADGTLTNLDLNETQRVQEHIFNLSERDILR